MTFFLLRKCTMTQIQIILFIFPAFNLIKAVVNFVKLFCHLGDGGKHINKRTLFRSRVTNHATTKLISRAVMQICPPSGSCRTQTLLRQNAVVVIQISSNSVFVLIKNAKSDRRADGCRNYKFPKLDGDPAFTIVAFTLLFGRI